VGRYEKREPSTGCHPEAMAKDLCPGGEARFREILRFRQDAMASHDPSVSLSVHHSANITGQMNRNLVHIIFPAKFLIDDRETAKDKRGSMTGSSTYCEKGEETRR
jgi:hypothetical protein